MPPAQYYLRLLGGFDVLRDGRRAAQACIGKLQALLAYLAAEADQVHTREALAGLLWPERDEDHARQSLRQALTALRDALGDKAGAGGLLSVSRETVALNPAAYQLDIAAFEAQIPAACPDGLRTRAACRRCHQNAAAHYRGAFLAGLSVPDAPEFDSWLRLKRERFARRAAELYGHLAACHEQSGELSGALDYARAQLRIDPWDEAAHRQVMRVLALGGSRNAALDHYRRMRAQLSAELGVEPDAASRDLYASIRDGRTTRRQLTPAARLAEPTSPWEPRECAAAPPGHAGERRVLTVLSLELCCPTEVDPEMLYEGARRLQQSARERIPEHGGAVRDCGNLELLAYFGYPLPCERPAVQAVRAAQALRTDLEPYAPRIRLHTGMAFLPPRARGACDRELALVSSVPLQARRLHLLAPEVPLAVSDCTWAAAGDVLEARRVPSAGAGAGLECIALHEVLGVRAVASASVPPAARRALWLERAEQQLEQLGAAKALAQLAACLGRSFSETQLQSLLRASGQLGFAAPQLAAHLETLVRSGVWTADSGGAATRYRFRRRALHRAALEGQSLAVRRLYRRMLGAADSHSAR